MHLNKQGCNRWVFLTRNYAWKFPALTSWRNFLYGILNNMNEAANCDRVDVCPILWRSPGGFLNVMPRARELTEQEFAELDVAALCESNNIVVEHKRDSFGWLGDRIVAIDYGWPYYLQW